MKSEVLNNDGQKITDSVAISLRLRLPVLSFVFLLIAAIFLPDRVWNTLLVGLGGMFVIAFIWVRLLANELYAHRQIQARWVAVGDRLEETFSLYNRSQIPALWVEVIDHSNVPGYQVAIVRSPGIAREDRWRQTAVCLQRGQFVVGPWTIRTSDPFGIFMMTRHYAEVQEIIIHPPVDTNIPISLPAGQSSGRKRARQRSWQARINAATVRAYVPGDPLRWIHWPTSAHRDELYVRLFDLDAAGDIWLLLDMEASIQLGSGIEGTEEQAVLLAASLAARALHQHRAVGLAGYGVKPILVDTGVGQGQEWRLLRALALIRADGEVGLAEAIRDLTHVARRNSVVIIITPNPGMGWIPQLLHLSQHGLESMVLLLDRPSFGGEGRAVVQQEAIHRLDLTCNIVRREDIELPDAARPTRDVLISPMGRAVPVQPE